MKKVFTATAIGALLTAGIAVAMQAEPAAPPTAPMTTAPMTGAPMTRTQVLARADARFAALDTNQDGRLSAQEREAARPGPQGDRGRRMLARVDADGDGLVSRAEYRAAAEARFARVDADSDGVAATGERGVGKRHGMRGGRGGGRGGGMHMMRADTNGDGVVTRAEFAAASAARFARMDRNGDGKLDMADRPQQPASPPSPPTTRPAPAAR